MRFLIIFLIAFSSSSLVLKGNLFHHEITKHQSIDLDTTVVFKRKGEDVKVHLKKHTDPSGLKIGNIVLLPGWNYSSLDWCTKTSFCEKARTLGFDLILVDMKKSVYASERYRETRGDMRKYATRRWFKDTLIPSLQQDFKLLMVGENNFVLGLSTGGRGSSLLCLDLPNVFKKGASLSGDYNQVSIPKDNLMRIFYGAYHSHKSRWSGVDNVVYEIDRFKVPFYIGHGLQDKVCPPQQSIEFYDSLRVHQPELEVELHIDSTAKHDYDYWGSEVDNVLGFFLK